MSSIGTLATINIGNVVGPMDGMFTVTVAGGALALNGALNINTVDGTNGNLILAGNKTIGATNNLNAINIKGIVNAQAGLRICSIKSARRFYIY